jgi:hypothetical protein
MSNLSLRGWYWLMPVMLGLAGCALQTVQGDFEAQTRVAALEQPPAEERTPPARVKKNIAAAKKNAPTLAVSAPAAPAAGQDEASCARVEDCASVFKAMVAGSDRSWVQRPAPPAVLSNGVRLFAYRALAPRLGCDEIALALAEVDSAAEAFSHPLAGLQPEQMSRTRNLSLEVREELRAERSQRCAAHAKEAPGPLPWPPQGWGYLVRAR